MRRFIDIAANLTDPMFKGIYHDSVKHQPDLQSVLKRSWTNGLEKIIITGTTLNESRTALQLALSDDRLYSTVGCHPTQCGELEKNSNPVEYLKKLEELVDEGGSKVVAFGECGLDYDRLHFCDKDVQLKYFEKQLEMSKKVQLPLFLHCRNAFQDFIPLLDKHSPLPGGVVHSFDGTVDDAQRVLDRGLYIGINGCSLKTEENLKVVKSLPNERLLLETDCPWCEVRPTHAGFKHVVTKFDSTKKEKWTDGYLVKSRNEPCNIVQILEIVAAVKNIDSSELCEQVYSNSLKAFNFA